MLLWLRKLILKLLKADYQDLDSLLHSPDGDKIRQIVDQVCGQSPFLLLDDERPLIERSYGQAQRSKVDVNGYKLRFLCEYFVGKKQGHW